MKVTIRQTKLPIPLFLNLANTNRNPHHRKVQASYGQQRSILVSTIHNIQHNSSVKIHNTLFSIHKSRNQISIRHMGVQDKDPVWCMPAYKRTLPTIFSIRLLILGMKLEASQIWRSDHHLLLLNNLSR